MTIQEALNTAVEGGYHIYGSDGMDTDYEGATNDYSAWTRKDNASSFMVPTEETFLDPQFWQALGRALGWSEACALAMSCQHVAEDSERDNAPARGGKRTPAESTLLSHDRRDLSALPAHVREGGTCPAGST